MGDFSLHGLLAWLYIAAAIVLCAFCLRLLVAAARIRRDTRALRTPAVERFQPDALPPRTRSSYEQLHRALSADGFVLVAGARSVLIPDRLLDFLFLYLARPAGTSAVLAVRLHEGKLRSGISFFTQFAGGPVVMTSTQPDAAADRALAVILNPGTPPADVYELHRKRVADLCARRNDWVLPDEGMESQRFLERISERVAQHLDRLSADRNWELDDTGACYIPTWRFALLHCTRYVWPFCAFVRRDSGRGFDVLPPRK